MSAASGATSEPPKASRWKGVVRVAIALALLAAVFWFVKWSDRLTWPSRFGDEPLVGSLVERDEGLEFRIEEGERKGDWVVLIASSGATEVGWVRAMVIDNQRGAEQFELTPEDRRELANQPEAGLKTALSRLWRSPLSFAQALLLFLFAAMLSFQRWQVLLRAVHVDARFWQVQRLGFLGLFFNNIIPGLTGGDLVKAIMVARDHPEQRPAAVLSVIVDRAIGLLGLALVASGALLLQHGRFDWMARRLNLILLAIVTGALLVLSRRLRRLLRLDKLLGALPFAELLKKLDRAALLYREARWQIVYAVGASLVVHAMILTAIGVLGRALGNQIPFLDYYALAPLALIASSLPVTPGGVGVLESLFIYFFQPAGVKPAAAFALAISYRIVQLVISLVGGVLLLVKHEPKLSRDEIEGR